MFGYDRVLGVKKTGGAKSGRICKTYKMLAEGSVVRASKVGDRILTVMYLTDQSTVSREREERQPR